MNQQLIDEIDALSLYNLDTSEGIKVHHTARSELISATKRLHQKGLITQEDGGYLTDLGYEAAQHSQSLITILGK